ncbi:MAG TPA: hypothetical protein VM198_14580 [Longimicrobiales bacterium]|nr:hypothetical protein [Longimicrobiales bacterium]
MSTFARKGAFVPLALTAVVTSLLAACGAEEQGNETGDMGDMPGMSAPAEEPAPSGMMESMRAHMERMSALPADGFAAVLPTHRQMVANMLSQMNREMSSMNMAADTAWTAVVDSLRSDLTRMPGMGAAELATLMPAHRERVQRLMSMHAAMMGRMGM